MNGKQGSVEKRPNVAEQIAAGGIGLPPFVVVHVPAAVMARQRKRKQILGSALALKDGYVNGLTRIAAFCHLDEGQLRKAYRDNNGVRELIEKRGGRFRIVKARLIDLDLILHHRRSDAHRRGALHPSRRRGARARFKQSQEPVT